MSNTLQQRTAPEAPKEAVVLLQSPEQALSVIAEGRKDLMAALKTPEEMSAPNEGSQAPSSGDNALNGAEFSFDGLVESFLANAA